MLRQARPSDKANGEVGGQRPHNVDRNISRDMSSKTYLEVL